MRPHWLVQLGVAALLASAFVIATDRLGFRHPLNIVWMVGLPVVLGITLNDGNDRKVLMTIVLFAFSMLVSMVVGVRFTSYS